jgi:RecB family endonuclease NucS
MVNNGFALYALCTVTYEGRACSTLGPGRFLILYKPDSSLMVHAAEGIPARNYMGSKSKLTRDGDVLTFQRRSERIIITIHEVITHTEFEDWSTAKTQICKTEKELAHKIYNNWVDYLPPVHTITPEYATDLDPIDLFAQDQDTDYIVEVKRRNCSIRDVTQLRRYLEAVSCGRKQVGYLASPAIGKNAHRYLEKHGLNYLRVDFD